MAKTNTAIKNRQSIKLSNYTPSKVAVATKDRGILFEAATPDGEPCVEYVSFDELYYINMKTKAIRTGELIIDEPDADKIYDALGLGNYQETVLTEQHILDMIVNASKVNQQKVINVKDMHTIERLRACAVKLINEQDDRVKILMVDLINKRYIELINNKIQSRLKVKTDKNIEKTDTTENEMTMLKQQNAMLLALLEKQGISLDGN